MFKNRVQLAIVLDPGHLSIATVRAGKIVQSERFELDPAKWDETWSGGLHQLDQPLRQLLARIGGVQKAVHAELFYTSPGSVCRVGITDLDSSTSIAKMESGLKQSVGLTNPVDAECLYTDGESSLTIGISDDESNLQKLFAWMNRSKVIVDRMIPSKSFDVQLAMAEASSADVGTTVLYISNRSSVIGYFEDGSPKLARLIEIGYDNLSDAYIQSMSSHGDTVDGSEMTKSQSGSDADQDHPISREIAEGKLFSQGIPINSGRKSGESAGIMPAMSPVLQRINIEIKQTFRFANSVNQLPSNLLICGPGAAVPMIGAALAKSLDMHVEVISAAKEYQPTDVFGEGTSHRAAACGKNQNLELIPGAAKELRRRSVLEGAIKIGAAAVIAIIGAQYYFTTLQSAKVQQVISEQSHVIERIELDGQRRESIRVMAGSIGTAAVLIEEAMGNRVDWIGFLSSIPNDRHPLIQISGLKGQMNGQHPIVNLTGTALAESEEVDASQVLSRYIQALREMPEVKRIEIGSTSRSLIDETHWGLNFDLAVEISTEKGQFSGLMALSSSEHGVSK